MESKKFIIGEEQTWVPFGQGLERHIMGYNNDLMVVKV